MHVNHYALRLGARGTASVKPGNSSVLEPERVEPLAIVSIVINSVCTVIIFRRVEAIAQKKRAAELR